MPLVSAYSSACLPVFAGFAGAYCDDFAALWLFFCGVGDDDAAFGFLVGGCGLDDYAVSDWLHTFDLFLILVKQVCRPQNQIFC